MSSNLDKLKIVSSIEEQDNTFIESYVENFTWISSVLLASVMCDSLKNAESLLLQNVAYCIVFRSFWLAIT